MAGKYQTVNQSRVSRSDHIWLALPNKRWKCVLCGAYTTNEPPDYPTEKNAPHWMPDRYEPLSNAERVLCPDRASH